MDRAVNYQRVLVIAKEEGIERVYVQGDVIGPVRVIAGRRNTVHFANNVLSGIDGEIWRINMGADDWLFWKLDGVAQTYAVLADKMLMMVVALALFTAPSFTTQLMLRLLSAPKFVGSGLLEENVTEASAV